MNDLAIRVENLSKHYRIGPRERYRTLRVVISDAFTSPFRRLGSSFQRSNVQTFQRSTLNSPFAFERAMSHAGEIALFAQRPPLLPSAYCSSSGKVTKVAASPITLRLAFQVSRFTLHVSRHDSAIRNRSCQRPPLRRSSFASPAVYGNMRAMCYEAPLLPSRMEARWPGRSCEREGRRLPGLSPWSTRQ